MPLYSEEDLISSKDVLLKAGISRATLNNYIKMGILPKPIVKRPRGGMRGVKQIGYFPLEVLERIERVKRLKMEGKAMDRIVSELQAIHFPQEPPRHEDPKAERGPTPGGPASAFAAKEKNLICSKSISLTLEDISMPAYFVDHAFEIRWINPEAQLQILRQEIKRLKNKASRNIFKLFLNWEFHNYVRNWLDIVAFHMSFAKLKYAKHWLKNLFHGISENEVNLLEQIYDRVRPFPQGSIGESPVNFFIEDGSTKSFRVYTIFAGEGILFAYAREGFFDLSDVK